MVAPLCLYKNHQCPFRLFKAQKQKERVYHLPNRIERLKILHCSLLYTSLYPKFSKPQYQLFHLHHSLQELEHLLLLQMVQNKMNRFRFSKQNILKLKVCRTQHLFYHLPFNLQEPVCLNYCRIETHCFHHLNFSKSTTLRQKGGR